MKATWNGKIIAESNNTIIIENNHYFPADSINKEFFESSKTTTACPLKGKAMYYSINIDGDKNIDVAWYYPNPKALAEEIKNYVAFWKGVEIVK